MTATLLNQRWRAEAACLGMDVNLFFPPEDAGRNAARDARAVCAACPVSAECLQHALAFPERHGVWAGTAERERRKPRAPRSAFPGVTWNPRAGKWVARAVVGGCRVHLGTFADEAEAGRAAAEARAAAAPQASSIPHQEKAA